MTTDSLSQSKELIPTFFQHLLGFVGDAIHTWFCASVQLWVLQFLFDLCFLHWKHPDFQPNTSYLTPTSDPYCKPHIRKLSTKYINRPIPSNSIICGSTNHAISEDSFTFRTSMPLPPGCRRLIIRSPAKMARSGWALPTCFFQRRRESSRGETGEKVRWNHRKRYMEIPGYQRKINMKVSCRLIFWYFLGGKVKVVRDGGALVWT